MRINSILFNILLLLLLATLIYLYLYINYSTYEGFDDIKIIGGDLQLSKYTDPILNNTRNGSIPELSFSSADEIKCYNRIIANTTKHLKNGYYWINLPVVGPKLIYCIADDDFSTSTWMLAMRGIAGGKTFNYDSKHWIRNSTLNADTKSIQSLFAKGSIDRKTLNGENKEAFDFNSIGSIINTNDIDSNKYDCKLDTFNYYRCSEVMIIFYYNGVKGGDLRDNNKGWVWKDTIVNSGKGITLLDFFYSIEKRDFNNINKNNNVIINDDNFIINKFTKDDKTASSLWYASSSSAKKFYNYNYEQNKGTNGYIASRIGIISTDGSKSTINGIGLGYNTDPKNSAISAGRYTNEDVDSKKGLPKDIDPDSTANIISKKAISFELYVR